MQFSRLANYLQQLEQTSKRLEITDILAKLLAELSPEETDKALYLTLGYLDAPFRKETFNIADKMMIRILSQAYAKKEQRVEKIYGQTGDLGDVALKLAPETPPQDLTILEIHNKLLSIAQAQGTGSQDTKVNKTAELLSKVNQLSAKYIVRIVLGTTRLGFTELTIIDALSVLLNNDKSYKQKIEAHYNMHPDIGIIAKKIKEGGIDNIEDIQVEPGVPILSQKPQRLPDIQEIIEKMGGKAWAEYKLDGTRVQLHLDRAKKLPKEAQGLFDEAEGVFIKTFTRNLEETTHQFPEIITAANKQINADSVILDGEAIAYEADTGKFLTFQESIKRKRKYDVKEIAKEFPLRYYVFDILYHNGKCTMDMTLTQRRQLLETVIEVGNTLKLSDYKICETAEELKDFFDKAKTKNLEGLVIKNPKSTYQAGARSYAWIKLKKGATELVSDDFDCVILGYYYGKGARSGFGIGGFLASVYDGKENKFKTLTRVGTGLKDNEWVELKEQADKLKLTKAPKNVEVKKELIPDVWVQPKLMVILKADEITKSPMHTAEYALRFPRFVGYRTDKKPEDATSVDEVAELYKSQKRGYY